MVGAGVIARSAVGGQQLLPLGVDTITTFHFLNDVSKEAIAICTLNTAQNQVTSVQYKAVSSPPTATFAPVFHEALSTYPNPVENTLNVHFTTGEKATYQLRLIALSGNRVLERTVEATAPQNELSIPVNTLPPGIYKLILLRDGTAVGRARVVKL